MTSSEPEILKILGQRIRKKRESQGFSQIALSVKAGFNFNYVGLVERGQTNPSLLALMNLSLALDTSVSEMTKNLQAGRIMVLRETPKRVNKPTKPTKTGSGSSAYPKRA